VDHLRSIYRSVMLSKVYTHTHTHTLSYLKLAWGLGYCSLLGEVRCTVSELWAVYFLSIFFFYTPIHCDFPPILPLRFCKRRHYYFFRSRTFSISAVTVCRGALVPQKLFRVSESSQSWW